MSSYLDYTFEDNEEFIHTFDEAPLWSAAFGLLMLKHLELKRGLTVIDIGSGAGFPLMELAARLGESSRLYGVDPWVNANKRARQKIQNYGLHNVEIIECSAESIPFDNDFADLVVSNLGINNFEDPATVLKECYRVMKKGARLVITTNLNGHWKEFYTIFENLLREYNYPHLAEELVRHQEHRGSVNSVSHMLEESGFRVTRHFEEHLDMTFPDGTAFLNHYFVKAGWLGSWKALLPEEHHFFLFSELGEKLNAYGKAKGYLKLSVPMAYIEAEKPQD